MLMKLLTRYSTQRESRQSLNARFENLSLAQPDSDLNTTVYSSDVFIPLMTSTHFPAPQGYQTTSAYQTTGQSQRFEAYGAPQVYNSAQADNSAQGYESTQALSVSSNYLTPPVHSNYPTPPVHSNYPTPSVQAGDWYNIPRSRMNRGLSPSSEVEKLDSCNKPPTPATIHG